MYQDKKLWIANTGSEKIYIYPSKANRHGLIAGATGTGKTTTLRTMAESFSDCGVPVFLTDVKGDLSGMCTPGEASGFIADRMQEYHLEEEGFTFHGCPVTFWDVYGEQGLPLRTTVSEMGPILLSRVLGLNATQEAVLTVIFKIADDQGLLLIDTKDLKSMLQYCSEHAKEYAISYGNMSPQSLAAIVRAVVALESAGGEQFFAEPALNIADWIRTNADGKGIVNILDCRKLISNPIMYGTFLLWMLSELYETLPEVGDMEKPRMVFFFDEAHLLFDDVSKALLTKIEQTVKLIRSKGVGIYFVTQSPKDVPDGVLAQLGNKVQHALHAYTPAEQKAAKAVAGSFRANPAFDTYEALLNMGTGEALVSVLDESGVPTEVQRCVVIPPQCGMGVLEDEKRQEMLKQNELYLKYTEYFDRDSAYEFLQRKSLEDQQAAETAKAEAEAEKQKAKEAAAEEKLKAKEAAAAEKIKARETTAAQKALEKQQEARKKQSQRAVKSVASTAAGTIGRQIGKNLGQSVGGSFGKTLGGNVGASIGRGILGTIFGGR